MPKSILDSDVRINASERAVTLVRDGYGGPAVLVVEKVKTIRGEERVVANTVSFTGEALGRGFGRDWTTFPRYNPHLKKAAIKILNYEDPRKYVDWKRSTLTKIADKNRFRDMWKSIQQDKVSSDTEKPILFYDPPAEKNWVETIRAALLRDSSPIVSKDPYYVTDENLLKLDKRHHEPLKELFLLRESTTDPNSQTPWNVLISRCETTYKLRTEAQVIIKKWISILTGEDFPRQSMCKTDYSQWLKKHRLNGDEFKLKNVEKFEKLLTLVAKQKDSIPIYNSHTWLVNKMNILGRELVYSRVFNPVIISSPNRCAITLIRKHNEPHAQILIENKDNKGQYQLRYVDFQYLTGTIYTLESQQGKLRAKEIDPSRVSYTFKSYTWYREKSRVEKVWQELVKEANDPEKYPSLYCTQGWYAKGVKREVFFQIESQHDDLIKLRNSNPELFAELYGFVKSAKKTTPKHLIKKIPNKKIPELKNELRELEIIFSDVANLPTRDQFNKWKKESESRDVNLTQYKRCAAALFQIKTQSKLVKLKPHNCVTRAIEILSQFGVDEEDLDYGPFVKWTQKFISLPAVAITG